MNPQMTQRNADQEVRNKAIIACRKSGQSPDNHFPQVVKMVRIGSGATRNIEDHIEDFLGMVEIGSCAKRKAVGAKAGQIG